MNKEILKRYSWGFLCLMCCLVGCTKEQLADNPTTSPAGKPVEMYLQVKAPLGSATTNNETAINRLRMVVFGSIGSSDAGKLIVNKYYATLPAGNVLKDTVTSGKRDIYLIVNEPLTGSGEEQDDYKKIATVADVRKLSLVYEGAGSTEVYAPTEIPMFREHINQQLEPESLNEIDGTVERTLAKVTLNLNIKNDNFLSGEQVVIDHITIKNLPESSYLIAQKYTGALVASEKQDVNAVTSASGYDFSSTNTFYVPEYLFDDPSKGAYLEIIGHINEAPGKTLKYSVKLGDAMDDAKRYGTEYHITRNRHYTFTGDVRTYGETDGVAVRVMVEPWNMLNFDLESGRYVFLDKVTDTAGKTIINEANLDDMGTTLNVQCGTNIGGWYTITRNAKGAIVHKSAATAPVSTITYQTVSITIPRLWELPNLQSYTVSVYQHTIAEESAGPAAVIRFTQHGGFIPNSVLTAAGWPTDKLPSNGLQIAKRGNKVLPGGVAEGRDPAMMWKTSSTLTPGTAEGFGMGGSSTAAMAGAEHPAAQYCREMGGGWFLPSINELMLLIGNNSTLGASYSFNTALYWSASDSNATSALRTDLSTTKGVSPKIDGSLSVRCVRFI